MPDLRIEAAPLPARTAEFVDLRARLYAGEPRFVLPLRSEEMRLLDTRKNPFFRRAEIHAFLLRGPDGRAAGRVAAIVNRAHDAFHGERAGFFGFFEIASEARAAAPLLLGAAEGALRERGAEFSRGPVNPSTNHDCGLLVEGFESPPAVMMPYNPPFYSDAIEGAGYSKAEDLLAWTLKEEESRFERVEKVARRALGSRSLDLRTLDPRRFDSELEIVRSIYNEAWSENFGFVPMEEDEFAFSARSLRKVLVRDLALIAEVDGSPAGFALALPDLNQALPKLKGRLYPWRIPGFLRALKRIRSVRVLMLGVRREYRHRGLDAILYAEIYRRGVGKGYREGEFSWVLERNKAMNEALEKIGARVGKRYRIYEKPLSR